MSLPITFAYALLAVEPPEGGGDVSRVASKQRAQEGAGGSARDAAWVRRIREGDESAFAALYGEYLSAMIGFAYRMVESAEVAEDIVADVFVGVWRHRHDWMPQYGARAYLFRAVRTRALDVLRHARVTLEVHTDALQREETLGTAGAPQPSWEHLDEEALLAAVDAELAGMPEMRRRVMELRWQDGLAIDEIGEVMGISRAAVDQHLSRGLRRLRQRFGL